MNRTLRLQSFLYVVVLAGCGGSDVNIGNNPDGGDDGSPVNDGSPAMDTGTPMDTGAMDSPIISDAATFDPSSVVGLVLWLDANKGITKNGSAISAWADQTTNHNDAAQTTAAMQPTFGASVINSLPAVHFNKDAQGMNVGGNMMTILDSTSLEWGTGDFYVVAVARFDNNVTTDGPERGEGLFYSKVPTGGQGSPSGIFFVGGIPTVYSSTNNPANGLCFALNQTAGNYVSSTNTYDDNTPHGFAIQRVGTTLDVRVDGVSIKTSTASSVDIGAAKTNVRIGGDANGAALRLDGDIAEMMAVKGTLSTSDRSGLEGYVKTKYGL